MVTGDTPPLSCMLYLLLLLIFRMARAFSVRVLAVTGPKSVATKKLRTKY